MPCHVARDRAGRSGSTTSHPVVSAALRCAVPRRSHTALFASLIPLVLYCAAHLPYCAVLQPKGTKAEMAQRLLRVFGLKAATSVPVQLLRVSMLHTPCQPGQCHRQWRPPHRCGCAMQPCGAADFAWHAAQRASQPSWRKQTTWS